MYGEGGLSWARISFTIREIIAFDKLFYSCSRAERRSYSRPFAAICLGAEKKLWPRMNANPLSSQDWLPHLTIKRNEHTFGSRSRLEGQESFHEGGFQRPASARREGNHERPTHQSIAAEYSVRARPRRRTGARQPPGAAERETEPRDEAEAGGGKTRGASGETRGNGA